MANLDDELAALLAIDALEPDEQADAELRIGTFPAALSGTSAALAELAEDEPPADLRALALDRATERRAPGRPVDAPPPCDPAEAFDRTVADLHELLRSLAPADWDVVAHPEHGRVRELIAHLVGVERLSARWLDPDDDVPLLLDHVEATRDVVEALAGAAPAELTAAWYEAASAVATAAASGDQSRSVTFHDLSSSIAGFLVTRTFELWAHSMDIAEALGRTMPTLDESRMALMSSRLMAAVPLALAYRRTSIPGRTARFVLTGPAGGVYTVALQPGERVEDAAGAGDVLVVADTIDICRVAARRLRPSELAATVEGDRALADLILAGLDAFARD